MALFIGIDLGTSGCRAIAIDDNGRIQGNTITTLPEPLRNNLRVEQNPALWWEAVCACLSELTTQINTKGVKAIAVDGTSASLLLVDRNGTPLSPAMMYNDARSIEQSKIIEAVSPTNTAAQGATCTLAKLLWLYKEGMTNGAKYAVHQADWISAKLCGQFDKYDYINSDYNNALKLGFDAELKTWPDWVVKLLQDADIPVDVLPRVVLPGTPIGRLSADLASRFNLDETTQVVAGTTDSTASFIATGANKVGDAVTSLGSTLVLKVISDKPVFSHEHGVYSQPLFNASIKNRNEFWLVGGASNSGGAVLRKYFTLDQLNTMTLLIDPETLTGLEYYPLPAVGERFPVNDIHLEPVLEPRPKDEVIFFQGILEGIARIEAKGYVLLNKLGAPYPVTLRTTGGGAKNEPWKIIRKTMMSEFQESHTELIEAAQTDAAYGSALLAQIGAYIA